jgi:chemotaxis protein CheX
MSKPWISVIEGLAAECVRDVFREMLDFDVVRDDPAPLDPDPSGQIVGSVGFVGDANGVIHLYFGLSFARVITRKVLGLAEEDDCDHMVNDSIGELGNVVVGRLKSRLSDRGCPCVLTIPSIVRGQSLVVGEMSETNNLVMGFRNCEHRLLAEVVLTEAAA